MSHDERAQPAAPKSAALWLRIMRTNILFTQGLGTTRSFLCNGEYNPIPLQIDSRPHRKVMTGLVRSSKKSHMSRRAAWRLASLGCPVKKGTRMLVKMEGGFSYGRKKRKIL